MEKEINKEVTKTIKESQHSESFRNKVKQISDYKEEFEKIFQTYREQALPRDELYFKIKNDIDIK
jgi:hypothetical protein